MHTDLLELLKRDKGRLITFYENERNKIVQKYQSELAPIDAILKELGGNEYGPTMPLFVKAGEFEVRPLGIYPKDGSFTDKAKFLMSSGESETELFPLYKMMRELDGNPIKKDEDFTAHYSHMYSDISTKAKKENIFYRVKGEKDKYFKYGLMEWRKK